MAEYTLVGGIEKTFKFSYFHLALIEHLLKVNLSSNETDQRVLSAIRKGAQKFSDYLLRSATRPVTLTRRTGAEEEDLRQVVREFAPLDECMERTVDFNMKVEDSFVFDLGVVQEQFATQNEDEAFFYLINFIAICNVLEKDGGAIHIYVSGQVDYIVVDEATPWRDIKLQGNIAQTQLH